MANRKHILPVIVIAQFFCTSLWFAGNAIMPALSIKLDLNAADIGYMTSSVQFGFIIGTLVIAGLTIADRFNASSVFFACASLGALFNVLVVFDLPYVELLAFRFMTGFFLAGIYPVGMKIASDYYEKGLGMALSFLVGALVLGKAFPHLVASFNASFDWKVVLYITSGLAILGGLMIKLVVPEGPYRSRGEEPHFRAMGLVFSNNEFRAAAFGYFGHMWELYAFWSFVPTIFRIYFGGDKASVSLESFAIIAIGALACVIGGILSKRYGARRIAMIALFTSGCCCLFSPWAFGLSGHLFGAFMIIWGMAVIADSPLFSTLVAQKSDPELKGTALTLVTCIGFAITIVSIQLLSILIGSYDEKYIFLVLAIGPAFGLLSLAGKPATSSAS